MSDRLRGIVSILIACLFFASGTVGAKLLSGTFSGSYMALARFVVGAVLVFGAVGITRRPLRVTNWRAWIGRGLFGALAMVFYYVGIAATSSGRATLLLGMAPAFVLVIGALFFSEQFRWGYVFGLALCIGGASLILSDGSSYPLWGDLTLLAAALMRGFALNYIRELRTDAHDPVTIYFAVCVFGLPMVLHTAPETAHITASNLPLLLAVSAIMFFAQIFFAYGFKHTSAVAAGLLTYLVIPLAVGLSIVFVHERITPRFIAGALAIFLGLVGAAWMVNRPGKATPAD
ncbi:MAG: DMT family transporter [Deltaproteobacteria bacterium]|nr:DMT family transporter [Deltaproteobacteria bacterium]MCB9488570.1 DMT family transporter [Deltaproteobacteria bacterium]